MDNDVLVLIRFLSKKSYLTLKDIERGIQVTRRQAMYRIDKLNSLLKGEGSPLISVDSTAVKGISIEKETAEAMKKLLSKNSKEEKYYLDKKERMIYMYLMLFLNLDFVSLNHFVASLQVSRSTVILDLRELTQNLNNEGIQIENNRSRGYFLSGSEMKIRRRMIKYVNSVLMEGKNGKVFDVFIDDCHLCNFKHSRQIITELMEKHHIRFVEDRLVEFIYIFTFLKARMLSGMSAKEVVERRIDNEAMASTKEYEFALDLLKNFPNTSSITPEDTQYIASWILGISVGNIVEDTEDCVLIAELVGQIMSRFESLSGVRYQNTEETFIQLYSHFRPAYYRLIFELPIYNPLCDKVKEEFRELYPLVEETMRPFKLVFGEEIPEEEIAYLTMHFAAIYIPERKENRKPKLKTAMVVCSNGIGSSAVLYNELMGLFPDLHFLPPTQSVQAYETMKEVDVIFATSYIAQQLETDVPVISVSPIMTADERYSVMRETYRKIGCVSSKQPNVDMVMNIISKYAKVHSENALYNDLLNYFSQTENGQEEINHEIHLSDMVRPSLINLEVEATDWEDALRKAYAPMVEEGFIKQSYVEDTVRCVKISGPYIVITKQVALPHTKPEAGAIKLSMGVSVLKEPVCFGSEENDPVKYIFPLCATDNKTHLSAMSEFMELLNTAEFYEMLSKAKEPEEVMQYLCK